ncbi:BTAD domain-containing putative transcriptional regulator [Streptomyces sp. NPDC056672]|uniref:AfsR/SARP family transcriptional regulator n=1 Tax=Streptomyces sp. NPDC056672 TaxID=3345906 RepID=UPI00369192FC
MGIRFAVLGPTRAWRDDVELHLGSPQQRATLTTLLLREGAQVALEELVDAIWGEAAPRAAISTLRSYISRLRRVIGTDVIYSTGGGYALRTPPGALDLTLFRQWIGRAQTAHRDHQPVIAAELFREALTLWRGSPLAGALGVNADAQRTLLTQMRLTAIEGRFAVELELGRHVELIAEISAQVAEHPLRERLREFLMVALYRSGRQADALAAFQKGRELLAEEIGVDPGPALRRTHQRILIADATLLEASQLVPSPYEAALAPRLTPAQLPPALPDFTGRGRQLKEITNRLTAPGGGMPVVGLVGLAGVGKTALALQAAHAVRAAFPDGQVYANLGATGEQPADASAVLAAFLRSYGYGDHAIPAVAGERAALWRTTVADRRVLVVLDDARDSDQIRDLFPGSPGSAVLVTSRSRKPELPGAHWCKIDVLNPEEALDLLSRVVGSDRVRAEPEAARRLVAACSRIPVAIRLAGVRLTARPGWTMAAVERHLSAEANQLTGWHPDCQAHNEPLMLGYRQLDAAQARAFRLVSLFEGTGILLRAAAEILQLPLVRTERLLESLADVHLIETDKPGHYAYHDQVKSFARRRAVEEDGIQACQAAISRLVTLSAWMEEDSGVDAETRAALTLLSHTMGDLASAPGTATTWPRRAGPPAIPSQCPSVCVRR